MWNTEVVIAVVGALLSVDGAAFVYVFWTRNKAQESASELHRRIDVLGEKFGAFQVRVAEHYVTGDQLKDVEDRITEILRRIERRLDGLRPSGKG